MAVKSIVSFTIERIGNFLTEEAKFLYKVDGQVQSLKDELVMMQSYLKEAKAKQEQGDERFRTSIKLIRGIAYDAEDAIDSYILKFTKDKKERILQKFSNFFCCLMDTHQLGTEIDAIKTRTKKVIGMLASYQVQRNPTKPTPRKKMPRSYPYISSDGDYIVGLEKNIQKFVKQLTNMDEHVQWNVLCIMGMGGCGKTTLARQLYNHVAIKQHFTSRAWICVSQEWDAKHILNEILRQIRNTATNDSKSIKHLVNEVSNFLDDKLYLIVLDALEALLPAFPNRNIKSRSKIIITSRDQQISESLDLSCFFYKMSPLTPDQSWELFSKITLNQMQNNMENYTSTNDFEVLGRKMLARCRGLPLAIVALGGILRFKNNIEEWRMVSDISSSRIMEGRGTSQYRRVKDMLALSYYNLPSHLKPHFLYFACFPEDSIINRKSLMRVWIGEGLITPGQLSGRQTLEDAASEQLDELIQRCMIQVAEIKLP